jgi:hypothetical protein
MARSKDLNINIVAKTKKLNDSLKKSRILFRKNFGEISAMATKAGRSMTMGLTAPLALMGVASVKAFDEQAKAVAQVEAGLKSTGSAVGLTSKELQKMASDLQAKTIFGDEEILKGATSQLLTFTNIAGDNFARTQKVALDLATRLDGDLKSASIQLGKALNDPVANLTALSRAGIQFSADQKAVIKSLVETGNLAEAQVIILDELEKQYGGSAEAAAQAGLGPFKQLANIISDLSEDFGRLIAEALTPYIEKIKDMVDWFGHLSDANKRWLLIIGAVAAAIGPLLMAVGMMMPALVSLAGMISTVIGLQWSWNAALLANPIGVVVGALAIFVGGIVSLIRKIQRARNYQDDIAESQRQWTKEVEAGTKALKAQHAQLTATATNQQILADLTVDNVRGALGRIDGLIANFDAYNELMLPQSTLDRVVELEEHFKNVETFGISPLAMAVAQVRDEMEALADTGGGDGTDPTLVGGLTLEQYKALHERAAEVRALAEMNADMMISENSAELEAEWHARIEARTDALAMHFEDVALAEEEMWDAEDERLATYGQAIINQAEKTAATWAKVGQAIGDAMGQAFRVMMTDADDTWEQIKKIFSNLILGAISSAIANAVASAFHPASAENAVTGGTAGAVKAAKFATMIPAMIPPFPMAAGGIVSGPMLSLVGEYPGAGSNPEVVAPLDKLRSMIADVGVGAPVVVTGRISGRDILISNERTALDRNRVRGN